MVDNSREIGVEQNKDGTYTVTYVVDGGPPPLEDDGIFREDGYYPRADGSMLVIFNGGSGRMVVEREAAKVLRRHCEQQLKRIN
jgi:hypothetical protein